MCEKDVNASKFYISWLYFGMLVVFQLGVLLGNFEYSNVYFSLAVQHLLNIQYLDGGFHSVGSQFVACTCFGLSSLPILKVLYLLDEDPVTLLASTNQPRIKCEKIYLNNSFESILDEDVQYSMLVENITAEETRDMFNAFAMLLYVFMYFCIFNLEYPRKLEATFLLIQNLSSNFR